MPNDLETVAFQKLLRHSEITEALRNVEPGVEQASMVVGADAEINSIQENAKLQRRVDAPLANRLSSFPPLASAPPSSRARIDNRGPRGGSGGSYGSGSSHGGGGRR